MIHVDSDVQTQEIGAGTRVWQYCVILKEASIGKECNICANVFIENDVRIGDRVTIKCGVQLWDGVTIRDDVFVGPNVTFTNDKFPRSRQRPEKYPRTLVECGASIGANATILPVAIGQYAMIGAGSVVTNDVPAYAIVVGNPARIIGYVGVKEGPVNKIDERKDGLVVGSTAKVYEIPSFMDMRGSLSVIEWEKEVPFKVKRIFYTYGIPSTKVRGEHAHKECHQFLVAVAGGVNIIADDGKNRLEFVMDSPRKGLYLPPAVWGIQYKHQPGTVLLVLASHEYDKNDYVRDYNEFLNYRSVQ